MRVVSRRFLLLATVLAAALPLGLPASAQTAEKATTGVTTIRVQATEFRFVLSSKSAPHGRVTFLVKNLATSQSIHDFKINGKKMPPIQPGTSARLTVTFSKRGKYPYRCTVDAHAAAGMRGVFTIR